MRCEARDQRRPLRRPIIAMAVSTMLTLGVQQPAAGQSLAEADPHSNGRHFLPVTLNGSLPARLPVPSVAPERGFYASPIDVIVTSSARRAEIRYSLDGSEPDLESPVLDGPLRVDRTTVLRVAAIQEGFESSASGTHSYIFPADVVRQGSRPAGWPLTWGVFHEGPEHSAEGYRGRPVPADYGMDRGVVDDPRTQSRILDDLRALPSLSLVLDSDDLLGADGIYSNPVADHDGWRHPTTGVTVTIERPVSMEWFDLAARRSVQVDAGLRIAGNWSRKPDAMAKHSFSLRFRSRYGPSRLAWPVFEAAPNGGNAGAPASFNSLRLRGGQSDTFHYFPGKAQYIHDQWARDTQRAMGWVAARGTWAHLYLNGLYWGLYNVTEEIDKQFAQANFGGDEDDWDVIRDAQPEDGAGVIPIASPRDGPPQFARAKDGGIEAFQALLAARNAGSPHDPAVLASVLDLLDENSFIDDVLLHLYADVWDWHKNWAAVRNRHLDGGFQMLAWDLEQSLALRQDTTRPGICGPLCSRDCPHVSCGEDVDAPGVAGFHRWLSQDAGYRLRFADRVRIHLMADGALTPAAAAARYRALADHVEPGIVGESARWGDVVFGERTRNENYGFIARFQAGRGQPSRRQTLDDHWRPERDRILRDYFPNRTQRFLQQLCEVGMYPTVAAPRLEPEGPHVAPTDLRIGLVSEGCAGQVSAGRIWYTLDGTDPRDPANGEPAASARLYEGSMPIGRRFVHVAARMRAPDGTWSAKAAGSYGQPRLVISELMYNPPQDRDAEWLELENLEDAPVELSGMRFTEGVTAELRGTIARRGRVVLAADAGIYRQYNPSAPLHGVYEGRLSNSGETLRLEDAAGGTVVELTYADDGFWPLAPDGDGYSLVLRDSQLDPSDPESWRASAQPGGSPGGADPKPPHDGRVVISEVMGATSRPFEDAIELENQSTAAVDISGWWLSDDREEPRMHRVPDGTVLQPGARWVTYEAEFRDAAPEDRAFGLSSNGETVYLRSAFADGTLGGVYHGLRYGASDDNVSFGRLRTWAGLDVVAFRRPTFGVDDPPDRATFRSGRGAPNAPPFVGPVIVSELLALPGQDPAEFVELHNVSDAPVALGGTGDGTAWAFITGITYTFPADVVLAPDGRAVLVGGDPEAFRSAQQIPTDVPVFGPWNGGLADGGETLVLARPPHGKTATMDDGPWFAQDTVTWRKAHPWPASALEAGASLSRRWPSLWGGDPRAWQALIIGGTPGRPDIVAAPIYLPLSVYRP